MVLNSVQRESIKEWCKRFFKENEKDYQNFDCEALIDNSLTTAENKTILRAKLKEMIKENVENLKKEDVIDEKTNKKFEEALNKEIKNIEVQAELEFNKCLDKIESDKTTETIEEVYYVPKQYVKMVANGNAKGFIYFGNCGEGKSYSVMRAFREAGKPFVYLSGHITPLELYQFLYQHRNENIVLDDVNVLQSEINLNMLKSCLNDILS